MPRICIPGKDLAKAKALADKANDAIKNLKVTTADEYSEDYIIKSSYGPVVLNTFHIASTSPIDDNAAKEMGRKRLALSNDAFKYINGFDSIRLRAFRSNLNSNGLNRSLFANLTGFFVRNTEWEYMLIGVSGDQEEVICSLNQDIDRSSGIFPKGYFIKSTALYDWLSKNKFPKDMDPEKDHDVIVNKNSLLKLLKETEQKNITKGKDIIHKPYLSRNPGKSFTLDSFKKKLGELYPFLFSNVYIVTDTNGSITDPGLIGTPVIFYSKFPKQGLRVDDVVSQIQGPTPDELGYIPLNESVLYSSVEGLVEMLRKTGGGHTYPNRRIVLSNNVIDAILKSFYDNPDLTIDMIDFSEDVKYNDTGKPVRKVKYDLFAQTLEKIIENPEAKDALNSIISGNTILDEKTGKTFKGIFISPVIISERSFMGSSIAPADESETLRTLMDENLVIKNLNETIINAPGIDLDFSNKETEMLNQFSELFNDNLMVQIPVTRMEEKTTKKTQELVDMLKGGQPLDLTKLIPEQVNVNLGHEIDYNISDIMRPFEELGLGLSTSDLENFVLNDINNIVMTKESINFKANLDTFIDENKPC